MSKTHLIVEAQVRYWEDATVNGVVDNDGVCIPCRQGDLWEPTIELSTGRIVDWPAGIKADIHYKVCDAGEYWLGDAEGGRSAKWAGHYVPDAFLCVGDKGFGDYIIMTVDENGMIKGWTPPKIKAAEWSPCVETFEQADALVEKLLTGKEEEFRLPLADARKMGGLLKDLLADMRERTETK